MPDRVLIIGGAGVTSPVPPVAPDQERWGMNNLMLGKDPARFRDCTHWFDLHHKPHIVKRKSGSAWGRYRASEIPVFLWETFEDLPMSRAYPRLGVQEMFGGTRLFASSLDWLLAYAAFLGKTEIELYGFRMTRPAYRHQVGSGRWWLDQCAKRGIVIRHLNPSALAKDTERFPPNLEAHHLMYGFETTDRTRLYRSR